MVNRMGNKNPVQKTERIVAIDVLRGFALLGILGANILFFDVEESYLEDWSKVVDDMAVGAASTPFMFFMGAFVLNKMMAVFSMLFGAGIILMTERIEQRGTSSRHIHYTRNFLLLGIGIFHYNVLWFGDVLMIYAVSAFFLYPFRRIDAKKLIYGGIILWLLLTIFITDDSTQYALRAPIMMLLGMGLYRLGIINAKRESDWYKKTMLRSFTVGLPLCVVATLLMMGEHGETGFFINNFGVPFMALGYVCLVMLICTSDKLPRVQSRLAAAGQMALTNYLMQTVLGLIIIETMNEIKGERVSAFWMMIAMFIIWAIELSWSSPWMKKFRFGPIEWAWRTATYRKMQAFRN